ncbi:MAG TPA: hypothetical protein VFG37_06945 [Planctomycetota bacterium]|nr:hypothetical protein [Planctomycetota bacterium]
MNAPLGPLVVAALAQAGARPPAPGDLPPLRVVVPFESDDAAQASLWFDAHAGALGVQPRVDAVRRLGPSELRPDTLLFGFEAGFLVELGEEGELLADAADVRAAVHPVALESWTLVWSGDGRLEPPGADSWGVLLDPRMKGRVRSRRVAAANPEGLVWSEVRGRLAVDLDDLLVAAGADKTPLPPELPLAELLRRLPEGSAALAPVRAAVLARRTGAALRGPRPREGCVGLTLAAAVTRGSGEAAAAVVATRLDAALLADFARALELEPAALPDESFPDWIRELARDRAADAIHRERAAVDLAQLLERERGGGSAVAPPEESWLDVWLDGVLLTVAAALILVALLRTARAPR